MPRYVLALDGGEDTGWALYDADLESLFSVREIDDFLSLGAELETWLSAHGPETAVIAERYVVTALSARKDPHLHATQVYGMARWLALKHGATFVMGQTSSAALGLVSDQWLRALGWYHPGKDHGNDACRHVVKYLVDRSRLTSEMHLSLGRMVAQEGLQEG